jgi:integrase
MFDRIAEPRVVLGKLFPQEINFRCQHGWRSLTRAAGFPGFCFHDLRHTLITHLAERNVPIPVIEAQVGHMSARMECT